MQPLFPNTLPKLSAGLKAGAGTSVVLAGGIALASGDWQSALLMLFVSLVPVAVQFVRAYMKTDPKLKAILEEMERENNLKFQE